MPTKSVFSALRYASLPSLIAFGLAAIQAHAQQQPQQPQQQCEGLLKPDVTLIQKDVLLRLSYLSLVTKERYEDIKRTNDSAGSLAVDGATLGTTNDYSEFQTRLDRERQEYHFNYTFRDLSTYYSSRLSETAAQDYVTCVAQGTAGIRARVTRVTKEYVDLLISWTPPPQAPTTAVIETSLIGAEKGQDRLIPHRLRYSEAKAVTLKREPHQDLHLNLNANGLPWQVFVPAWRDPIPHPTATLADTIVAGGACIAQLHHKTNHCFGTLARSSDYTLRYDASTNGFTVRGHICNTSHDQIDTRFNANPLKNTITLWGAVFQFTDRGALTPYPAVAGWTGTLKCTAP
jgi:hypothetical protein